MPLSGNITLHKPASTLKRKVININSCTNTEEAVSNSPRTRSQTPAQVQGKNFATAKVKSVGQQDQPNAPTSSTLAPSSSSSSSSSSKKWSISFQPFKLCHVCPRSSRGECEKAQLEYLEIYLKVLLREPILVPFALPASVLQCWASSFPFTTPSYAHKLCYGTFHRAVVAGGMCEELEKWRSEECQWKFLATGSACLGSTFISTIRMCVSQPRLWASAPKWPSK